MFPSCLDAISRKVHKWGSIYLLMYLFVDNVYCLQSFETHASIATKQGATTTDLQVALLTVNDALTLYQAQQLPYHSTA